MKKRVVFGVLLVLGAGGLWMLKDQTGIRGETKPMLEARNSQSGQVTSQTPELQTVSEFSIVKAEGPSERKKSEQIPVRYTTRDFDTLTSDELKKAISSIDRKIKAERWLERMNDGSATQTERVEFADMLQRRIVMGNVLAEKHFKQAERLLGDL